MHPNTQHLPTGNSPGGTTSGAAIQPAPAAFPATGKLVRLPIVEGLTGLKRSSIYKAMRERSFPGSVRLSARAVAWRESEVLAWCANRTKTGDGNDQD